MTSALLEVPIEEIPDVLPEQDRGLQGLCGIAAYFRVSANPAVLARELALARRPSVAEDLVRAANIIGLQARWDSGFSYKSLSKLPVPSLLQMRDVGFVVYGGRLNDGRWRMVDPVTRADILLEEAELATRLLPGAVLVRRRFRGPGIDPDGLNLEWFFKSVWRYRLPLLHVLLASMVIQIFALITPLFFQVVVDKVLIHRSLATLNVIAIGLVMVTLFDAILQFLRTYTLNHTTNRIDVELGQRLFAHLLRLPIHYFETRPAGQTVARIRELENIRSFLTGNGLSSILDLLFTLIFFIVLFYYSASLACVVLATLPVYVAIAFFLRPALEAKINEKFNRGAASQQFLVESVIGIQTVKASAVEPQMRAEWDDRLAAYIQTSFDASKLSALGQGAIQVVSRLSTAGILFLGAKAVMNGEMTIGSLVAFNMIAGQVSQPVLRLSQLWQEFQQIRISMMRLGDVLNAVPEPVFRSAASLPPPSGHIEFSNVSFRYNANSADVLKHVSLTIKAGEVVGIVGPSGSGKSSLAKLVQRFYMPHEGHVLVDGIDLSQVDPVWLRSNVGVVLQENILFNRTIHENIAFADPSLPRARVIAIARMAGAHEFISKMPQGYDSQIEERGSNLSGGQRQRIAIARALATNPRILIFDEATSALDYESEQIIQKNMKLIAKGRTVILIAHRLSTVRDCDRIFGMADGQLVESGTHSELLERKDGLYARLWSLQFGEKA